MDRPALAPAAKSRPQPRPLVKPESLPRVKTEVTDEPPGALVAKMMTLLWVFLAPGIGAVAAAIAIAQGQVRPIHLVLLVVGFVATGLGVTVGYHRLLTHQSFET